MARKDNMYYDMKPSDVYLRYKNIEIYNAYKNDDYNSPLTYWFGVSPWVTDADIEDERSAFDIRETRTESIPFGKRKLEIPYEYDPHKTIDQNLINLIKLGGIDNQDFIEDTVYAFTIKEGREEVLKIYHMDDLCFQELFGSLKFPNMQAEDIIHLYSLLSEEIDGDKVYIEKSSGETERL